MDADGGVGHPSTSSSFQQPLVSSSSSSPSPAPSSSTAASANRRELSDRRLFVSNLAPQVSEHDLLTLFKPFGTLRKLDLIFHRSGPQKGKPKGYAFVELAQRGEAEKARRVLEGRAVKGREIRINYATINDEQDTSLGPHRRKRVEDPARPTTLSLVKNLQRNDSTDARIAAMEAKLSALKKRSGQEQASEVQHHSAATASLPPRPDSLPAKPTPHK